LKADRRLEVLRSDFGTTISRKLTIAGGTQMDVTKMLDELKQEREQLEEAIITLERLVQGRGKRRGRPPAWLAEARKREAKEKAKLGLVKAAN